MVVYDRKHVGVNFNQKLYIFKILYVKYYM